jgi:BlaI family penicillinase repressor
MKQTNEKARAPRLGKVQLRILQVLWKHPDATAREVTDELNRAGKSGEALAHSTVQTLLRQLEAKGVVTHSVEGRVFRFRATTQQKDVAVGATRELLSRVFNSSVPGLVAHLLQHEKISDEEMARLKQIIEEAGQ